MNHENIRAILLDRLDMLEASPTTEKLISALREKVQAATARTLECLDLVDRLIQALVEEEKFISFAEAAEALRVSKQRVSELVGLRGFPVIQLGKNLRGIRLAHLNELKNRPSKGGRPRKEK